MPRLGSAGGFLGGRADWGLGFGDVLISVTSFPGGGMGAPDLQGDDTTAFARLQRLRQSFSKQTLLRQNTTFFAKNVEKRVRNAKFAPRARFDKMRGRGAVSWPQKCPYPGRTLGRCAP